MTWGAVAVGVGSVASGAMSANAAKDAASAGQEGAQRAGEITAGAADRARKDIMHLFPQAQEDMLAGYNTAFDITNQGIGEQQRLLQQGNLNAQGTTAGGFDQVRAALMGLPVGTQNFAPQGVDPSQLQANPFNIGGPNALFGSIAQNQAAREADAFGGINTNRDLIAAFGSGDLEATGIDPNFWRGVSEGTRGKKANWWGKDSTFFDDDSLLTATPEQQQEIMRTSGLNSGSRHQLGTLIDQYRTLRG